MSKYFIFGNSQFVELLKILQEYEKKIKLKDIFLMTKNKTKKLKVINTKNPWVSNVTNKWLKKNWK